MHHTSRIWSRLLAYLVDLTVLYFIFSLLLLPWAHSLSSPISVTSGAFSMTVCGVATIHSADGSRKISLKPGQNLAVCDIRSTAIFPSRIAYIEQAGEPGSKFETTSVSFLLDDMNRIKGQADTDTAFLAFLLLTLIALEGSRFASTPGKLLMRLKVADKFGQPAGLQKAAIRNLIKFIYVPAAIILALVVSKGSLYLNAGQVQAMYFDDDFALRSFSQIWGAGNATTLLMIFLGISTVNIIIFLTILFPWKDKGRGIYDRLAGTMVVSRHEQLKSGTVPPSPSAPAPGALADQSAPP